MPKKDFTAATGRTYGHIADATSEKESRQGGPASIEEQEKRKAEMRTQGREGCKLTRISMAFQPANADFIRVMAAMSGMSMTCFVNQVIAKYREEHPEQYEQAKALQDSLYQ